jgi:hypothetical protein
MRLRRDGLYKVFEILIPLLAGITAALVSLAANAAGL